MAELLVSLAILIIITLAVAGDVSKTRKREELVSSTRLVHNAIRDAQARAQTARSVQMCNNAGVNVVCEADDSNCGIASCDALIVPVAVGVSLTTDDSFVTTFAEIDVSLEDRRNDASGREYMETEKFAEQKEGSNVVFIKSLTAGTVSVTDAAVTFERQSGNMQINGCPNPPCSPAGATTLEIVLEHGQSGQQKAIRLNALTGKISLE
jgi:Tfp pilus assembly protein FimT